MGEVDDIVMNYPPKHGTWFQRAERKVKLKLLFAFRGKLHIACVCMPLDADDSENLRGGKLAH